MLIFGFSLGKEASQTNRDPPALSPTPAKSTTEAQNRPGSITIFHYMPLGPLKIPMADSAGIKPTNHRPGRPRLSKKPHEPKCFFNLCWNDNSLALVERLFHILAPRKEKAFCPCAVFFLGILASVFVMQRLRAEHKLFFSKSSQR